MGTILALFQLQFAQQTVVSLCDQRWNEGMATHKVRGREECGGRGSAGVKMKAVNDVLQQDSAWERHSAITPFDPDRKDNLKPQRSLPSTHRTCHSAVPPPRGGSLHSGHSLVPRGIKIADHADGATHCLLHNHCTLTCTSEKIASNRPQTLLREDCAQHHGIPYI